MLGQRELRGHKPLDLVAAFASPFVGASRKLPGVRILMTVAAHAVCQAFFEIASAMAFLATHVQMPAAQRKCCQVMIEGALANARPAFCGMACRAGIAETSVMRIAMAWCAIRKRQASILHKSRDRFIANFLGGGLFQMAFAAGRRLMPAGEQKLRLRVRKFCRGLPCCEIVTALAGAA